VFEEVLTEWLDVLLAVLFIVLLALWLLDIFTYAYVALEEWLLLTVVLCELLEVWLLVILLLILILERTQWAMYHLIRGSELDQMKSGYIKRIVPNWFKAIQTVIWLVTIPLIVHTILQSIVTIPPMRHMHK
jgi:hypothetical protein